MVLIGYVLRIFDSTGNVSSVAEHFTKISDR